MTAMQFAAECNRHIEAGHEFLAYWHPQGFMLLRQGTVKTTEYYVTVRGDLRSADTTYVAKSEEERDALLHRYGNRVEEVKPHPVTKKVKASAVSKLRKIIGQLRKSMYTLYTVEYAGGVLVKEGADPDGLQAIRIPGSGD